MSALVILLTVLADGDGHVGSILTSHGLAGAGVDLVVKEAESEAGAFPQQDRDALRSIGLDLELIRSSVEQAFGKGALDRPAGTDGRRWWQRAVTDHRPDHAMKMTESVRRSLELARSRANGCARPATLTDLAFGVLRSGDDSVRSALAAAGADVRVVISELEGARA